MKHNICKVFVLVLFLSFCFTISLSANLYSQGFSQRQDYSYGPWDQQYYYIAGQSQSGIQSMRMEQQLFIPYLPYLYPQDNLYGLPQVIPTVATTSLPYGYPSSVIPTVPIRLNTPGKFYINLLTNTAVWSSTSLNPEIWWDAFTPISMKYKDPLYHEISWNPLTSTLNY